MSHKSRSAVERLMGRVQHPGSPEEMAAIHLRSAANRSLPGAVALARVRRQLEASVARPIGPVRHWKTILAVFALGIGLGGATAAAIWGGPPWRLVRVPAPAAPSHAIEQSQRRARAHAPEPTKPLVTPAETRASGETRALADGSASLRPIAPPRLVARAEDSPVSETAVPSRRSRRAPGADTPSAAVPAVAPAPAHSDANTAARSLPLANDRTAPGAGVASPGLPRGDSAAIPVGPAAPAAAALPAGDLAEEAHLLGLALRQLHSDHDARASLKTLSDHAARFPHSTLKPEADVTRVEALLALDRHGEALVVLDGMSIPTTARGRSLAVVRGELRASAHRCPEAIPDFSQALAASPADGLADEALHGRIACLIALGENGAARQDAQSYLQRFPSGRFAVEVRRVLGGTVQR